MADEKVELKKGIVEETKPSTFDKFRDFVKQNKTKIIAGFAAIVGWLAGDSGIWDAIRTVFFGA